MFWAQLENQVWTKAWPGTPKARPGSSNQACRFRNFFLDPIPELFSASFSSHFQDIQKIMSTPLTLHYFLHFQELHEILSTKTQTWPSWLRFFFEFPGNAVNNLHKKIRNGAQKKVLEPPGLVGDDLAVL